MKTIKDKEGKSDLHILNVLTKLHMFSQQELITYDIVRRTNPLFHIVIPFTYSESKSFSQQYTNEYCNVHFYNRLNSANSCSDADAYHNIVTQSRSKPR